VGLEICFTIIGFLWVWLWLTKWWCEWWNHPHNISRDFLLPKAKVTKQPKVVKKEEAKSNKWDWKEYRRHSHDTSFIDASMWLSMGDD